MVFKSGPGAKPFDFVGKAGTQLLRSCKTYITEVKLDMLDV